MGSQSRVAVVTGANKGIGLAIGTSSRPTSNPSHQTNKQPNQPLHLVRNLALDYPKSTLNSGPFTIYLTARSASRGAEAVETLHGDSTLKQAGVLAKDGGSTTIKFHALDISQENSIRDFRDVLKKEHPDGIDAVINNAGKNHHRSYQLTARQSADILRYCNARLRHQHCA